MNATSRIAAGLAIAAACSAAFAQDAAAPAASRPDAIATTPETAKAANDKAIKRSDVATVVRTGPTAADHARQAGDKTAAKVDDMSAQDGTTVATSNGTRTTRDATRAPRADRN